MRRKRILAKLLALSLMVSGLPMTSVYAAELPEPAEAVEQEAEGVEGEETTAEDSAVEDIEEKETDTAEIDASAEQDENAETEVSSFSDEETAIKELKGVENVKMAGSNGILYDNVTYLSARNVLAMDAEMQELYRSLCDGIADAKEGGREIQDVVFAVDENGDLYFSAYAPMRSLEEIQADMLPDVEGVLTPDTEESLAEEKKDGETSEDGKDAVDEEKKEDETSEDGKDAVEEEKQEAETSEDSKDAVEEEKKDDETSEDGKDAVEEEKKDDETSEGSKETVEDDETSEDSKDAVEEEKQEAETVEDEQAAEEESDELFEENLDLIPEMEEETFEEIESVRIENTLDLGYGNGLSDGSGRSSIQFNSVLPTEDLFTKQLSATQKKYYELAKAKMTKGSNKISFNAPFDEKNNYVAYAVWDDADHAVSALILAYPDKTDWMAKPGGSSLSVRYRRGAKVGDYTYAVDKSKYYSGSLDSKAKAQVQTIGNQALQSAAEKYPTTPVYGIIEYFDQWICENGYYEDIGTLPLTGHKDSAGKILTPEQYLKSLGLNSSQVKTILTVYYKCHSAYGMLLEGYGVCESYAKTMSRLLDAVGIPNLYVVGYVDPANPNTTGHAWNYVQMPNGSWYLLDSTWNDDDTGFKEPSDHITSNKKWLLVPNDGQHYASGANYVGEDGFTFPALAGSKYAPNASTESVTLNKATLNLIPKGKEQLTFQVNKKDSFGIVSGIWSSDNSKVATVDQKGNVTAKAAGTAVITVAAAGMTAQCAVNVDQIKAVKTTDNKTSTNISLGNTAAKKGSQTITLNVDMGASPHDAQWMIANDAKTTAPVVASSKTDVVTATATVTGNTITVKVDALKDGNSKVTVKFGGKTVTLNVTAGQIITKEMFDVAWPTGETAAQTYAYTGKAIKPTVKKKTDDAFKQVTYKTTYVNNVNAGTAKLVLTGTGKYGGVLEYPYTITPLDITEADFSKELKSKPYNGGDNPPATVVKLGTKVLKANKDYEILYDGKKLSVVSAGKYTITIRGIGNYVGTVKATQPYEVTKNLITKVAVAGTANAKYTGLQMNPFTVKIGKNELQGSDYTITWYQGQGNAKSATPMKTKPVAKGKYTAVITVKGSNLTNTDKKTEIQKNFTIK